MFKLYIYLVLISFNVLICYSNESVVDNSELVLTLLIHRHGDRTPLEGSLFFSTDAEKLISLSAKYGYGQLTDVGKRRAFQLGQFIRRRYDGLLSPYYNKSEIYIRSTDSTRAKMTILSALAAVYPVDQDNWSQDINWTPVPYTTVSAKYDFNLASINCPTFITQTTELEFTPTAPPTPEYRDTLNKWSEIIGMNITEYPAFAYAAYDVYTSQMSMGVPLTPELEAIFPEIEAAAGVAMDVIFGNKDTVALSAGVLLNQFFTVADQIISGEDIPRVHVYSAHDTNVMAFEAVTQVPRQGVPKYASAYALELRKMLDTGKYVVLPVYLNTPSEDTVTYLQVDGCGEVCDLETFRSLSSNNILNEDDWRVQCDFSEDYNFDTSSID